MARVLLQFRGKNQKFEPPIFKKIKINLPKNHKTPEALNMFLESVRSELLNTENRKEAKCNITE